ncbi:MAG: hypothetical protein KDG55_17885 [Rhodocyclaceae bacterium]|nr:hypothetical protein [Rhodocyclaceae bacterium]
MAATRRQSDIESTALRYCAQPPRPQRVFDPSVSPGRVRAILNAEKKWVNGTQLTYHMFSSASRQVASRWRGREDDLAAVRKAFDTWAKLGLGISFREVERPEEAMIRIGFDPNDGSWSYVGRDVLLERNPAARTMNFGWPLTTAYGADTALHEIGHTLGLEHEHQNPFAGITWNEPAVRAYFRGPPNSWDDQTIEWNILRKISQSEVKGTNWDPDSVMEYQFGAGLIDAPAKYRNGLAPKGGLSKADKEWVASSYPAPKPKEKPTYLQPGQSVLLALAAGETRSLAFRPTRTRSYKIGTFGDSDTLLVLFEAADSGNVQIGGDDDSGADRNALIRMRLVAGREYRVGVRLYYSDMAAETALMVW